MLPALDPNLIYLILFVGLWVGVTAAYVPGTGLIELVSIGLVIFGIYILTTVAVNWWALGLLIIGAGGFLVMPLIKRRYTLLGLLGLALQSVGGIFLLQETPISPLLVLACTGLVFLYHQFALRPALERGRLRPITDDDESLIGARGRVLKPLTPIGTIHLYGESWTAQSDTPLEAGQEVVVIEREGLTLLVEPAKHKNDE